MPLVAVSNTGEFPDVTLNDLPGNTDVIIANNSSAAALIPLPGAVRVLATLDGGIEPTHNERDGVLTLQPHSHIVVQHVAASAETVVFSGMETTHKTAAAASTGRGTALFIQPLSGGATWTP